MAKKYFKNNPAATSFYDVPSELYLVNDQIGVLENFNPVKHKEVAQALRDGRIFEVSEKDYIAQQEGLELVEEEQAPEVDEFTVDEEETEVLPLEGKNKEELMAWAEEQTFITEEELNEAKKLKKAKELRAYLQDLLDFENQASEEEAE